MMQRPMPQLSLEALQEFSDYMDDNFFELEGRWVEMLDHHGEPRWIDISLMTEWTPQ